MEKRFFVTIAAPDVDSFAQIHKLKVDLIHGTAKVKKQANPSIEALVTLNEVHRLVEAGYRVTVEEEASKRARANQIIGLQQWLKEMGE